MAKIESWRDNLAGETRRIEFEAASDIDVNRMCFHIQGLPQNIRPVTDGPYVEDYCFFDGPNDTIGIELNNLKIVDFRGANSRDRAVFKLVKDKLKPGLTLDQHRISKDTLINSQYLR